MKTKCPACQCSLEATVYDCAMKIGGHLSVKLEKALCKESKPEPDSDFDLHTEDVERGVRGMELNDIADKHIIEAGSTQERRSLWLIKEELIADIKLCAELVKIEKKEVIIRKAIGKFIYDPCPLTSVGICRDCSGRYKQMVVGETKKGYPLYKYRTVKKGGTPCIVKKHLNEMREEMARCNMLK